MKDFYSGTREVRFFHVCTDGTNNGVVHFCDKDYQQAIIISALVALELGVTILCFVHMSTHSHFLICCRDFETAKKFGEKFKSRYSRYVSLSRGVKKIYLDINSEPKEVADLFYLKNCCSYILLNPVVAGITRYPEDYRWSSFNAYFSDAPDFGRPVGSIGTRELRSILSTRQDLKNTTLRINDDGTIVIKSFVDFKFIEILYGSKTNYYKSLALTNSVAEEEKYVSHVFSYSDEELLAEFQSLAGKMFGKDDLNNLSKAEKHRLIFNIRKKIRVTPARLARLFRVPKSEINAILGQ